MSNPGPAEEVDLGTDPTPSVRSQASTDDSLQFMGSVLSAGRKWAEKVEDNWWCLVSERLPKGAVKFKLTEERNKRYDGAYLPDSSEDDVVQLENVLPDATHILMDGNQLDLQSTAHDYFHQLAGRTIGELLQLTENCVESLSITSLGNFGIRHAMFERILIGVRSGKLEKLRAFRWDNSGLNDAGVSALAKLIEEDCLPILTELSFRGHGVGSAGVTDLCSALHHVGDLRVLDLQGNKLGSGHLCLAEAMQCGRLQALETINLHGSGMGDADFEAYAKAMCSGKLGALKDIDFGNNRASFSSTEAVGRGLQSGQVKNLERLCITGWLGGAFSSVSVAAVATAMEEGMLTKLVDLNLGVVNEEGIGCLTRALQSGNVNSLGRLAFAMPLYDINVRPLVEAFSVNTALVCALEVDLTESLRRKYELQVERNRRQIHRLEEMGGRVVPASFGKVYLCGNPEVGKTTLRKSLQRSYIKSLYTSERRKHVEPRTRGIEICKMLSKGCPGENDVTLTLWDMAGQEDYHIVHNSFLPGLVLGEGKATMFVVMCTSKSIENAEIELRSWFKFIASSVNQSTGNRRDVFVVVNRWDGDTTKPDSAHVWKSMLSTFSQEFEKHLRIKADPLIVDARKRKAVECIKQALIKQTREMLKREEVPEMCNYIQTNLSDWGDEKKTFPVLSRKEFDREIRRKGADWSEKALEAALEHLDEAGELIYVQKESTTGKLIILNPTWFCKYLMGNIFLPEGMGVEAEQLFRKNVDSSTGSISIERFIGFFQSLEDTWESSKFEDLLTILLWTGLCYKGREGNIFIPSLIQEDQSLRRVGDAANFFEDRETQWAMGFSVGYAQSEITLAPIALWYKFLVQLAQLTRYNGRLDNDFVVGKYVTHFKVDHMVVRIQVNADENCPTFDCIEITVKPLFNRENDTMDSNTRKQCQLDLAGDIAETLLDVWHHVCPGIDYVQRVIWPWPVSHPRPETEQRQNVEVNEVKKWIQEHGSGRRMDWHVGAGETITEDQLLSTKDKEAITMSSLEEKIRDTSAALQEAIELRIFPNDVPDMVWTPKSLENEASSSLQQPQRDDEVLTKILRTVQDNLKVAKETFKVSEEILQVTRENLQVSKEMSAKLHQVMTTHKALQKKVEDIGRTFLQDREKTCPQFVYVGKRSNAGSWIRIKDAMLSTVQVKVHVYFACEANYNGDGPHEVKNQPGIDVSKLKDWAQKILPLVKISVTILLITAKVSANLVAPGTGLIIDNFTQWQQASSLAEGIELATGFSAEKLDELAASDLYPIKGSTLKDLQELYGRSRQAMTKILTELSSKEFEQKIGLRKVCLKYRDGSFRGVVWICTECFENYSKAHLISELN